MFVEDIFTIFGIVGVIAFIAWVAGEFHHFTITKTHSVLGYALVMICSPLTLPIFIIFATISLTFQVSKYFVAYLEKKYLWQSYGRNPDNWDTQTFETSPEIWIAYKEAKYSPYEKTAPCPDCGKMALKYERRTGNRHLGFTCSSCNFWVYVTDLEQISTDERIEREAFFVKSDAVNNVLDRGISIY